MARKRVIDVTSATTTLSKNQSNSLVVLNRAAGIVVTLPSAGRGLEYDFVVKADSTGTLKIIGSDSASMRGVVTSGTAGGTAAGVVANGLTHIAISLLATAGGCVGTTFKLICDKDGMWNVSGNNVSDTAPVGDHTVFATT